MADAGPGSSGLGRETQPERTYFAWRRTSLSLVAAALLSVAVVVHRQGSAAAVAVLVPTLVVAAVGLGVIEHRVRVLSGPGFHRMHGTAALMALVVCVVAALGGVLVVLTSH
jgi:uncharacterized membrane protein YidH (DUF202 family)